MDTTELEVVLTLFAKPTLLRGQLEKDLAITNNVVAEIPETDIKDISADLLQGIAESLDDVKPVYKKTRQQLMLSQKDKPQHRDMTQAVHLAGEAYKVVKDHWAEIYFIINMLNKKGYLDKVKNNPKLKTFFSALLDKK